MDCPDFSAHPCPLCKSDTPHKMILFHNKYVYVCLFCAVNGVFKDLEKIHQNLRDSVKDAGNFSSPPLADQPKDIKLLRREGILILLIAGLLFAMVWWMESVKGVKVK